MSRLISFVCITVLALILGACGGNDPITAESKVDEADEVSPIVVEVVQTYFSKDPLARFAVEFSNPQDRSRVGVKAEWKALDADAAIIGTHDVSLPPIPAGESTLYVGGAGGANLAGVPVQVRVTVTDEGRLVDEIPAEVVTATKAEFKKAEFQFDDGATTYDVSALVTAEEAVSRMNLGSAVILRDAQGVVVGSSWLDFDSAPDALSAGDRVRATTSVWVSEGTPATIEVYVSSK